MPAKCIEKVAHLALYFTQFVSCIENSNSCMLFSDHSSWRHQSGNWFAASPHLLPPES